MVYNIGCVLYPLLEAIIQQLILAQGLECEMQGKINLSQLVMCISMREFYLTNENCQNDKSVFTVYMLQVQLEICALYLS